MSAASTRPRVLIVEDERPIAEFLALALRDEGYEVTVARDGIDALAAARATPPALILCDVMLPRMDGPDLLQALRAEAAVELQVVPVVFMSAAPVRERADRAGAIAFLQKPFDLDALLELIRRTLAGG